MSGEDFVLRQALRHRLRKARSALSQQEKQKAARTFQTLGMASGLFETSGTIGVYIALADEADPAPLCEALAQIGKRLALPRMMDETLGFHLWSMSEPLLPGPFGTQEPSSQSFIITPDCLIVPLLAFDSRGGRLGYGKGFYDRFLGSCAPKPFVIGLAFSLQEIERVPMAAHDQYLDAVLTEKRFHLFR
jgi:5-formyltetrahydrofolate cyclo-ligase